MRRVCFLLLLPLLAVPATAQITVQGTSIFSLAVAATPGCTISDSESPSMAACQEQGYTAAASAQADATASVTGGSVFVFAQGAASSVGGNANRSASGNGSGSASATWQMDSETHYSLSSVTSNEPGAATIEFSSSRLGALPPSGVLPPSVGFPPEVHTLRGSAQANALAQDLNGAEFVSAGPFQASAEIRFAEVGSPTLILGVVSSGGNGVSGLMVEALVGATLVASTTTGDDGTYLLPGLPGAVVLRVSDPTGAFATQQSGSLTPPLTFHVELAPSVPGLAGLLGRALLLGMLALGWWAARAGWATGRAAT